MYKAKQMIRAEWIYTETMIETLGVNTTGRLGY